MNASSHVIIVGMPRSGTTLIGTILDRHPEICISPETHFLVWYDGKKRDPLECWREYRNTERYGYLKIDPEKVEARFSRGGEVTLMTVYDAIIREYAATKGKAICGEKTPAHYDNVDTILRSYPLAKIVWVVRDPKAVVASYLKVPWHKGGVVGPSLRWRACHDRLIEKEKTSNQILRIRYEDFVCDPGSSLTGILEHVGVDVGEITQLLDIPMHSAPAQRPDKWATDHLKAASSQISQDSLVKWKKNLSRRQVTVVEFLTRNQMALLGYRAVTNISGLRVMGIGLIHLVVFLSSKPDLIVRKIRSILGIPDRSVQSSLK